MRVIMRRWLGLAIAIALSVVATESPGDTVPRSVLGSGATTATGSGRQLQGTAGQVAVGASGANALSISHGFWAIGTPQVVAVDPAVGALPPSGIEFGAPTPNPSRGALAFTVGLPHAARVALLLVDVQGRAVAPADSRLLTAGRHRLVFDPARGADLASGIYFARLSVNGRVEATRRFVRVR
jgi:hypothetical protein